MHTSISVIMPALNEEGNLAAAVHEVVGVVRPMFSDYEILILNDGSADQTGPIADALAAQDPHIKVIHNRNSMGLGYNYGKGVELAANDFVIMIPGDNEIPGNAVAEICGVAGSADIVIPYFVNSRVRPLGRRIISRVFVMLMNTLFGLRLRYYNGPCIHKSAIIKKVAMSTTGFAYMAATLVRLIKAGHSFVEVGVKLQPRGHGRSKAFALRNVVSVVKTIVVLLWEVRLANPSSGPKSREEAV